MIQIMPGRTVHKLDRGALKMSANLSDHGLGRIILNVSLCSDSTKSLKSLTMGLIKVQ